MRNFKPKVLLKSWILQILVLQQILCNR